MKNKLEKEKINKAAYGGRYYTMLHDSLFLHPGHFFI
jgi:hypothetical protein